MGQGLYLSQTLRQDHSLLLGQRMALCQKMVDTLEAIRSKGGSSPGEVTKKVIRQLLDSVTQPTLREGLEGILSVESLQQKLINNAASFALPTRAHLHRFSIEYIHERSTDKGVYSYARGAGGEVLANQPKTSAAFLIEAFEDPAKFEVRLAAHQEMLTGMARSSSRHVSFDELHELQDARMVIEHVRPSVDALSQAFMFLLSKKDEQGQSILKNFLTDVAVLEKLDCFASERLQKRFVHRFKRVRMHSDADTFEEAMLNTIGEYTLVSMGIIAPEIFVLSRGEIPVEMFKEIGSDLAKEGIDLKKLLGSYRLRSEGTFFFNRYHTIGRRPCAITDDLIRTFITRTVREDRKAVLEAVKFEDEFLPKVAKVVEGSDHEDLEESLRESLIELFNDEEFQMKFLALLRGWYKYFDMFYR